MMFRRHDHRDGFPLTIALPFMAAVLSVIPGVTHESGEVRRAAFATAMVLFGIGVIALLVWICRDQRDRAELRIQLDSFVTLVTHSGAHRDRVVDRPDDVPEPVVLAERRRRCRWRRVADVAGGHGMTASGSLAVGAVVGAMMAAALTGSPQRAEQPGGAAPLAPAMPADPRPDHRPPPDAGGLPTVSPPTASAPAPPVTVTRVEHIPAAPVTREAEADVMLAPSTTTTPVLAVLPSSLAAILQLDDGDG